MQGAEQTAEQTAEHIGPGMRRWKSLGNESEESKESNDDAIWV